MKDFEDECKGNYRLERVNRLLHELRYEVTRAVMERDLEELFSEFFIPINFHNQYKTVRCRFEVSAHTGFGGYEKHVGLKVVK